MFKKSVFTLDGEKSFTGYSQGEKWNGFECPYFTFAIALRVLESSEGQSWIYNPHSDVFIVHHSDDLDDTSADMIHGIVIRVKGKLVKVYAIGAFNWAWEQYKPRTTHYIAMAGLKGCLPQYCASHDTYESAVDDLGSAHTLETWKIKQLRKDGYLELRLHRDGNEYCEIVSCDCDDPSVHNDN